MSSLIVEDRVVETSTTTGTGAIALAAAVTGYRRFSSVMSVGDTCYYTIEGIDAQGTPTGEWETGYGTYSAANTLTRTTVSRSSNSNAAVSFSTGTKRVFLNLIGAVRPVMVLISSITTASAGDPVSFTNIPGVYKDLVVEARLRGNEASAVVNAYIRFNNDTAANYDYMGMQATAAVLQNFSGVATATPFCGAVPSGGATAGFFSSHEIRVPLYASTTMEKIWSAFGYAKGTNVATNMFNQNVAGSWRSTAAINRVDLVPSAGTGWAAGSIVDLYGRW